jgi:hypothetical protein
VSSDVQVDDGDGLGRVLGVNVDEVRDDGGRSNALSGVDETSSEE